MKAWAWLTAECALVNVSRIARSGWPGAGKAPVELASGPSSREAITPLAPSYTGLGDASPRMARSIASMASFPAYPGTHAFHDVMAPVRVWRGENASSTAQPWVYRSSCVCSPGANRGGKVACSCSRDGLRTHAS